MLAEVAPLVDQLSSWVVLVATCLGLLGTVGATCWKVARWVDRQEDRWTAVDVVLADWRDRGLTPEGAVAVAQQYRDLADAHTSALADHKARLDGHDERLERLERAG